MGMQEQGRPEEPLQDAGGHQTRKAQTDESAHEKVQAEIDTLRAEAKKLDKETGRIEYVLRTERLKAVGALLSGLVIVAALGTGYYEINQARLGRLEEGRKEIAQNFETVVRELSHNNAGIRLSAAINVRQFIGILSIQDRVISLIVAAIPLEGSAAVRVALGEALMMGGKDALAPVRAQKEAVIVELNSLFTGRETRAAWREIKARQAGLLALAIVESRVTGGPVDLRNAEFTCFELIKVRLPKAILSDSTLQGANLWGADLKEANLRNADFIGADLRSADVTGADLAGAVLDKARINNANFRGAKNLDIEMFPRTDHWWFALFDPQFQAELRKHYLPPRPTSSPKPPTYRDLFCSPAGS